MSTLDGRTKCDPMFATRRAGNGQVCCKLFLHHAQWFSLEKAPRIGEFGNCELRVGTDLRILGMEGQGARAEVTVLSLSCL